MTAQPAALSDSAAAIEISGLSKWFGDFQVLRDISLTVRKGERIVFIRTLVKSDHNADREGGKAIERVATGQYL